jgi:integrase
MILTVKMKNITLRGEIYHFRMGVPKDCVKALGKTEITQSLYTTDKVKAMSEAQRLTDTWSAKFNRMRTGRPQSVRPVAAAARPAEVNAEGFREQLLSRMKTSLPKIFAEESAESLRERSTAYHESIDYVRNGGLCDLRLPEIGIRDWPSPDLKDHRVVREYSRVLIDVLQLMRKAIDTELGDEFSAPKSNQKAPACERADAARKNEMSTKAAPSADDPSEKHSVMDVAELMLASKKRIAKTEATVRADVRLLQEWIVNKKSIAAYTKKDLIDFVCNCLPYIPANITKKKEYKGMSLRKCIELTRKNPEKYPPISYITCCNRLVNIAMVFNYAKDYLDVIKVNPAKGIEIPQVRVIDNGPRGFTANELTAMWGALQEIHKNEPRRPSRFWATVLSLYHGFRLNEVCSLFLKDVYEDADGVFVIDVNANHATKSVKNQSSVRIVPVHPFVRDQLGFKAFVEEQKRARIEGLLFQDLSFIESKGYITKVSSWFKYWKTDWLPADTQSRDAVTVYLDALNEGLKAVQADYNISEQDWSRYVEGLAGTILAVEGNRQVPLMLKGATVVSGAIAVKIGQTVAEQVRGMIFRAGRREMYEEGAMYAGRYVARGFGGIAFVAMTGWDIYDHHRTVSQNTPVMRRLLSEYFDQLESLVLNDSQCGILQTLDRVRRMVAEQYKGP